MSKQERRQLIIDQYMDKTSGFVLRKVDNIKSIEAVNELWKTRPKSNIVKWLMRKSLKTPEDVAYCLGCTPGYLNNKLNRESFSLEDIIIVAYICGFALTFTSNKPDEDEHESFQVDLKEYFAPTLDGCKVISRLYNYDIKEKKEKREQYEQLKAQLEQMKEVYGFED